MIGSYCGLCQLRFSGFSLTAACHHSVHFEISGSGVREGGGPDGPRSIDWDGDNWQLL